MKNGKEFLSVLVLILVGTIFNSCNKIDTDNIPVIPPVTSLSIEFPILPTHKSGPVDLTNWQFSTVSLALWNTFLNKNCEIPITSFRKSIEAEPKYIENNTWEWVHQYSADTILVKAKLQGKQENDSVSWKLYITTVTPKTISEDFLWIEGKSISSGGWWLLNEKPSDPNPYIRILWTTDGDNISNKYIYLKQSDPDYGSFLLHGTITDSIFDAYYNIKLPYADTIFIELNKADKQGRIKSNLIFNDTFWHCWDSSYNNINCNN